MAFWRGLLVVVAMACACAGASAQQTGRRVALVIGNSTYAAQGTLANPGPDSRLVADALRRVGFSVVAQTDLGKAAMDRALRDFSRQADGAEVALVYYAGHGMEANGTNWLVPVDATLADERDLNFEAVSLDTVLATVDRARGLRMVVLDACRNNPFTRSMRRGASSTRAVTRGLADVEVTGTLVMYSARGGSLAQDGPAGGNSPFATALARRIPEPGVDIRVLVGKVRDDVLSATSRGQEPFSYGSLPGVELMLVNSTPREDMRAQLEAAQRRILELENRQKAPVSAAPSVVSPAANVATRPGVDANDLIARIRRAPSPGTVGSWAPYKAIFLAYDTDGSGAIDRDNEVQAMACDVLLAIDGRFAAIGDKLTVSPGFAPSFGYVGDSLGVAASVRDRAYQRMRACGVRLPAGAQ